MIVQKFGGSCLDTPADIRRMARIVKSYEHLRPIVVLSAFKGVTEELIGQVTQAETGRFDISTMEARHLSLLDELPPGVRIRCEPSVRELLTELAHKLTEVAGKRKATPEALDGIAAYGEKLAVSVASGYFAEEGVPVIPLFGAQAGIRTNGVFGDANILDESYRLVRQNLSHSRTPVVAGFFGEDQHARVTTLGRGSSDYVAAFIAAAIGCTVQLFKDVDGVMTADPKIVGDAKLIPRLDYLDAMELSRLGSKVLFEKAVAVAEKAGIRIMVRSFTGLNQGTVIGAGGDGAAITCVRVHSEADVASLKQGGGAAQSRTGGLSVVSLVGMGFRAEQMISQVKAAGLEPREVFGRPSGVSTCIVVNASQAGQAVRALHALVVPHPTIGRHRARKHGLLPGVSTP